MPQGGGAYNPNTLALGQNRLGNSYNPNAPAQRFTQTRAPQPVAPAPAPATPGIMNATPLPPPFMVGGVQQPQNFSSSAEAANWAKAHPLDPSQITKPPPPNRGVWTPGGPPPGPVVRPDLPQFPGRPRPYDETGMTPPPRTPRDPGFGNGTPRWQGGTGMGQPLGGGINSLQRWKPGGGAQPLQSMSSRMAGILGR